MPKIINRALLNALATALYIFLVVSLIFSIDKSNFEDTPTIFVPIAMLMLLVFSAALTGSLMFGTPIIWYLDGKKKQALSLLIYTLIIFLIITLAIFILVIGFLSR